MEGLEVVGEERNLLRLIRRETKGEELEDTVRQAIKALKSTSARSIRSSEWSEAEGVLYFRGKIYVPPTADIRWKIMALHHTSDIAGHLEDSRAGCLKLLVAAHVTIHCSVHCYLRLMPPDQGPETAANWSFRIASHSQHPMGYRKRQLYSRTSGI